jgi:hypothetical protein
MLTQLSDPGKLMRWAMAPLDPKALQMLMKTIDPNVYVKWMMSPLDPRALQLMTAPVNPNLYMGWLGASMNPGSYGDMWKGFLNPAGYNLPALPAMPAMPTAAATPWAAPAGAAPMVNPFDLNALTQMFQIPAPAAGQPFGFPFALPTLPAAQ